MKSLFSIGDPSKIFEILRNKMYSDPIYSVCREIMCNARDAHREVNNNNPIEITLPDFQDSYLRIKDYGPGISPDRMENVYIKYTNTTKTNTDQTGGFGLGAKSPFAITDVFSVITCVDGIKYHYINYIDASEQGICFLLDSHKTTEPNGTEIVIPINNYSIDKIKESIFYYSKYWTIKPKINESGLSLSVKDFKDELVNDKIICNEYFFIKKSYNNKLVAIIDDIPYTIDQDLLNISLKRNIKCEIFFILKKDQVNLSSTRENIYYSNSTIEFLEDKISNLYKTLYQTLQEEFDKCENIKLALHYFNNIKDIFHLGKFNDFLYKNVSLHSVNESFKLNFSKQSYGKSIIDNKISSYKEKSYFNNYYFNKDALIIINDNNTSISKREVNYLFNKFTDYNNIYFFSTSKSLENEDVKLIISLFPETTSKHLKLTKQKTASSKRLYFEYTPSMYGFQQTSFSKVNEDLNKKIFIKINKDYSGYTIVNREESKFSTSFKELINIKGYSIYGYKDNISEKELKANFKNIFSLNEVIVSLKQEFLQETYFDFRYKTDCFNKLINSEYYHLINTVKDIENINLTKFNELIYLEEICQKTITSFENVNIYKCLYFEEQYKKYISNIIYDIQLIDEQISETYPMLKYTTKFPQNKVLFKTDIINYIKSISKDI